MPSLAPEDHRFLREAIRLSFYGMRRNHGGPFGCVIVSQGRIVARGWNQVLHLNDPTAHAEIQALRKAGRKLRRFRLDDCIVYSSCQPCPMCLSALYWAGVAAVWFATSARDAARIGFADAFISRELARPAPRRSLPLHQALRSEALAAFDEWHTKHDKIPY